MKRVLVCLLALVTMLSCFGTVPTQAYAKEVNMINAFVQDQGNTDTRITRIEAFDQNTETIIGKPGTGTPVDLVPMTGDEPARRSGTLSGKVPTEQEAYEIMIAQKAYFPEGMTYTNDDYYQWNGGIWRGGYGCAGFCFYLSDLCFGDRPCYQVFEFTYNQIRVGDILRVNNDKHSVTVMEKYSDYIVLAEANYGGKVHWGRILTYNEVMQNTTYLLSRYPKDGWYTFDGYMYYFKNDVPVVGWANDELGYIYYFDDQGRMSVGWKQFDDGWRYFNEYGYMAIGWQEIGGEMYCFTDDGVMLTGWVQSNTGKWYYLDDSGALQVGWVKVDGKWYYTDEYGAMQTGWVSVSGKWYYLNSEMMTGWQKISGKWYYLGGDGVMQTGWIKVSGVWYYLNSSGVMQTGWVQISGKWYYLGSDGVMQTGWQKIDGKWYYLKNEMKTGWQQIDGKWYYLNNEMKTGWQQIDGKWYYLKNEMKTEWQKIDGSWYYLGSNGAMRTGWQKLGGKWYYLGTNGIMRTGTHTIDGKTYTFNSNGVWIP